MIAIVLWLRIPQYSFQRKPTISLALKDRNSIVLRQGFAKRRHKLYYTSLWNLCEREWKPYVCFRFQLPDRFYIGAHNNMRGQQQYTDDQCEPASTLNRRKSRQDRNCRHDLRCDVLTLP